MPHQQQQSQQPQVRQTMDQQQTRFSPNGNSNHALQDYMMQLMLLDQQNKKRHLMYRQWEEDDRARVRQAQHDKTNRGGRKDSKL
ncbi:hypothetical protein KCU98_g9358, partial [Aureobasidium melanogenum]